MFKIFENAHYYFKKISENLEITVPISVQTQFSSFGAVLWLDEKWLERASGKRASEGERARMPRPAVRSARVVEEPPAALLRL